MRIAFNPRVHVHSVDTLGSTPEASHARTKAHNARLAYEKRILSEQVSRLTLALSTVQQQLAASKRK